LLIFSELSLRRRAGISMLGSDVAMDLNRSFP
jgi:hypothetical protein